jgi:flagellar L-ring protein precursor FlgH
VPQTDAPGLVISPPGQPAPGDLPQAAAAPAAPAAGQPAQPGNVQAASLMSAGPAGPYVRTDPNSPDRGKQAGPSGDGRSRSMSAAVGALQQVSFTATAAPESRRFQLHDLVTIIVREETSAQSDGQSTQDKKYNLDSKLDSWMKLHWGNAPLKPVTLKTSPEIKTENERKLDSTGTFIRKDSFVGRLTAEVIDVKPNGTLVLSARKFVKTDDEEQTFELTGVCRVADLTADNSVLSTQLADLSVSQTHEGQVRDTTKRGWQSWLTDKINPW